MSFYGVVKGEVAVMSHKVFSFFTGSGLLDLGFEDAGMEIVFVNEYFEPFMDAYKYSRTKLKRQRPKFGYSLDSIENFLRGSPKKHLTDSIRVAQSDGSLIGFIGGPPCPDFSVGGKNRGHSGENGRLSRTYVDLIIQQKPDWFVFENVKGLIRTAKHKEFFDTLISDLRKAGYVFNYSLMNSIEFGVPQDRDRIILFGIQKSLASQDILKSPQSEGYNQYAELLSLNLREHAVFPHRAAFEYKWPETHKFSAKTTRSRPNSIPLELTVQHWFEKNDVDHHPNSKDHFQPREALSKFEVIEEGDVSKKSFKRLHRWRYSPTAAYGNNEVHLHPYKARRLSVAEALAIQSMPKDFCLPPDMTLSNMFKTIGNGVPYLFAYGIGRSIQKYLSLIAKQDQTKIVRKAASNS